MKVTCILLVVFSCALTPALLAQQPTLLTVLHGFAGSPADGAYPYRPLVVGGNDNAIYGCTPAGGTNGWGTIFRINRDGSGYSVIHNFSDGDQGIQQTLQTPALYVTRGSDGALYGTSQTSTNYPNGMVFKLNTDGSGYTVLHSFTNSDATPLNLMQGRDGALYGAGFRAIFKLDTDGGNYNVLHIFNNASDGTRAYGRLIQGTDGALYGATYAGGTNNGGTIFKINTNGTGFTILHTFTNNPDGASAYAGLTEGSDGALYGVTRLGGTNNVGVIFKLNQDGSGYQILHHFQTNGVDGTYPYGDLVQGLNNILYGTTYFGGPTNDGTIFEIGLDGSHYSVLRSFGTSTNVEPNWPVSGLVQGPASDGSGVLYGVANWGGGPYGSLYSIVVNPPLSITPLVSQFAGQPVVAWPAWALNYQLQSTTNLADTNSWVAATNGILMTGFQPAKPSPGTYYRLVWPQ